MNRQIIVIVILVLLLFSSIAVGLGSSNAKGNTMKISNEGVKGYTTHGVIRINSNADFANQASQEGWPGNGTKSNPYVISGYDINAGGAKYGIYIGNTTSYFIIENCHIYNIHSSQIDIPTYSGGAVTLYKVQNATIQYNTISGNEDVGILIAGYHNFKSSYINVRNNNISNNSWYGILMWDNSSKNIISGNTITNNRDDGIYLEDSSSNTISGNNITNNRDDGIYLDSSNSNTISGNNITSNGGGICLSPSSSNNTISGNTITNNEDEGIHLGSSSTSNNTISGNTITNNSYGIGLNFFSNNNTIYNNLISNNTYYGIYIDSCSYNLIYNNSLYYNHGSGDVYDSSHVQAKDDGTNNYWYSSSGIGNYWHDWANNNNTNDQNNDGIVDWPYKIDGSAGAKDYYPLKNASLSNVLSHPMNLTAKVGDGYVNLTWDPPVYGKDTVTQYKIYRNGVLIKTVSGNQLYYHDTKVQNGQTYTYYVTAVNSVGESEKSNEVQATLGGEIPGFFIGILIFIVALIALLGVIRVRKFS